MQTKKIGKVETESITLNKVSYVPDLAKNLLSVNKITSRGDTAVFTKEAVHIVKGKVIFDEKDVTMSGVKNEDGLFIIDLDPKEKEEHAMVSEIMKWHCKCGHLNFKDMQKLPNLCESLNDKIDIDKEILCESCVLAKITRRPFSSIRRRATRPMQIVHTDVCGPITPETYD